MVHIMISDLLRSEKIFVHPKNLKLNEEGISKVLGSLEAEVMDVIWESSSASVRKVCDVLCVKKSYSFNTIMTIMNRLVEKKLLQKKRQGSSFVYRAAVEKHVFLRDVTKSIVSALVTDGSLFQVAAFAEALHDCSEEDKEKLREIINGQFCSPP